MASPIPTHFDVTATSNPRVKRRGSLGPVRWQVRTCSSRGAGRGCSLKRFRDGGAPPPVARPPQREASDPSTTSICPPRPFPRERSPRTPSARTKRSRRDLFYCSARGWCRKGTARGRVPDTSADVRPRSRNTIWNRRLASQGRRRRKTRARTTARTREGGLKKLRSSHGARIAMFRPSPPRACAAAVATLRRRSRAISGSSPRDVSKADDIRDNSPQRQLLRLRLRPYCRSRDGLAGRGQALMEQLGRSPQNGPFRENDRAALLLCARRPRGTGKQDVAMWPWAASSSRPGAAIPRRESPVREACGRRIQAGRRPC